MIVRINQFEVGRVEQEAGWASGGMMGPVRYEWPTDARSYEVLILEQDEQRRPPGEKFRQGQMRQLIPQAVAALREAGEEVVVRLDGPFAKNELLPALSHLTDDDGRGRFTVTEVQKLDPQPLEMIASVRLQPPPARL